MRPDVDEADDALVAEQSIIEAISRRALALEFPAVLLDEQVVLSASHHRQMMRHHSFEDVVPRCLPPLGRLTCMLAS